MKKQKKQREKPKRASTLSPNFQIHPDQVKDSSALKACYDITANFKKNIQNPLTKIQSVDHSKTLQRCLLHNNVITLYCQFDRKPLCAGCMYQTDVHRKHRVVPVNRAQNMMREDIKSFEIKLEDVIGQIDTFRRKVSEAMIKNQKFYPVVVTKLKQFYEQLQVMLKQMEKQQISQILDAQERAKMECLALNQESMKIGNYISDKLNYYSVRNSEQHLTTKRNMFEILIKTKRYFKHDFPSLLPTDQDFKSFNNFDKFPIINDFLKSQLILTLPGTLIIPRSKSRSISKKKLQDIPPQPSPKHTSPSPRPKSKSKSATKSKVQSSRYT